MSTRPTANFCHITAYAVYESLWQTVSAKNITRHPAQHLTSGSHSALITLLDVAPDHCRLTPWSLISRGVYKRHNGTMWEKCLTKLLYM